MKHGFYTLHAFNSVMGSRLAPLSCPKAGDFLIDGKLVEIGGRKKDFSQVKDHPNAYLVSNDLEVGLGQRIPLWLFGFTS